jgi:hypothetical protein
MTTVPLHTVVSKQIPEFIRAQYPLFVEFIEAYYAYQDQYEQRDITELRDIDETLTSFIQYFKNELDIFGSTYPYIDQRLFLRKSKELFTVKGVEDAYKFLFRILYNQNADISYPWNSVLIPSSGIWNQDISIFVDATGSVGDITTLPGNKITINGVNQIIKVVVVRVKPVRGNIYEVFIDRNYYGDIQTGYKISFNNITGTIIPTTVSYFVANAGAGYRVGDLIVGSTVSNGITITQKLKVTKVNNAGGVVSVANITFGCGYSTDFYLSQNTIVSSTKSSLRVTKGTGNVGATGYAPVTQYNLSNDTNINKFQDYGYAINPDYDAVDYQDPSYVGTLVGTFYQESTVSDSINSNYLLIGFNIGAVARYQGYYSSNNGFLDDSIVIQDSYKYQKYSYMLTVNERLSDYINIIKSYLHPAGSAVFGEFQIQNTYKPPIEVTNQMGKWQSIATFSNINIQANTDYVFAGATGSQGVVQLNPYVDASYYNAFEYYNPPVTSSFAG